MKTERSGLFTYQGLHDKENRNLLMFDLIRRRGVISRAEITKATGINAVSISNYINNFMEKGLVLEKGFDISTGGRKPELVELNTESNYVIGIAIGGTEIRGVLADIGLDIKVRKQAPRPCDREVQDAVVRLVEEIMSASKINSSHIKAIGLGIPDLGFIQITDAIRKKVGIDAFAAPSSVCAAFVEKRSNKDADVENMLYIYSDVGEGVMMHGDTCLGASDDEKISGGGVMYLNPWNEYLSIVESAKREVARGVGTRIVSFAKGGMDNITREVVVEAARDNDEVALNIVQSIGMNLGLRIAYLVNLFGPEVVVLGGGANDAGDIIFMPVKKMVERFAFFGRMKNLKIIASTLDEDVVDIGAASLAIREIFLKV